MFKSPCQKGSSAKDGESKKTTTGKGSTYNDDSRGESSKNAGKYVITDTDYEIALRMQRLLDEESTQDRSSAKPWGIPVGNHNPPYPEDIQDAVNTVQKFIATIMNMKCHGCGYDLMFEFDVGQWFREWSAMRHQKHESSICAIPCPNNKCRALTCLGCGDQPRVGKFVGKHDIEGLVVDWCCERGRLFAIWALLCRYDQMELKIQSQSVQRGKESVLPPNPFPAAIKNTSYAASMRHTGFPPGYGAHAWRAGPPILSFKQADSKTDRTTRILLGLTIELLPLRTEKGKAAPPELSAMIELSLLQDRAAELLRNDSLQDATNRAGLYFALFEFFERLGKHPDTAYLVYEKRFVKKQSNGLHAISKSITMKSRGKGKAESTHDLILDDPKNMAASLVNCMSKLAKQSKVLLMASQAAGKEFRTAEGEDVLEIANRAVKLYASIATNDSSAQGQMESSERKNGRITWEQYHQDQCMVTEDNILAYVDSELAKNAKALVESPRNRIKRLVTEISEMSTSLPLNIFVKADAVRPDLMKCLIIGPEGTPYHGGLFEFDVFCPKAYPNEPPQVWFRTTAGGIIRFNPNLYQNGKVCLSLLGTWPGPLETQWQPTKSTLLSVLVSIQAIILCKNPLTNEPGMETLTKTPRGRQKSTHYDHNIQVWTLRFALLDWLHRPAMLDGVWKDVVETYFRFHAERVLAVARRWAGGNPLVRAFDGRMDRQGATAGSRRVDLVRELEGALGVKREVR